MVVMDKLAAGGDNAASADYRYGAVDSSITGDTASNSRGLEIIVNADRAVECYRTGTRRTFGGYDQHGTVGNIHSSRPTGIITDNIIISSRITKPEAIGIAGWRSRGMNYCTKDNDIAR